MDDWRCGAASTLPQRDRASTALIARRDEADRGVVAVAGRKISTGLARKLRTVVTAAGLFSAQSVSPGRCWSRSAAAEQAARALRGLPSASHA